MKTKPKRKKSSNTKTARTNKTPSTTKRRALTLKRRDESREGDFWCD